MKGRSSRAEAFQNFKLSASRGSPRTWSLVHESYPWSWRLGAGELPCVGRPPPAPPPPCHAQTHAMIPDRWKSSADR